MRHFRIQQQQENEGENQSNISFHKKLTSTLQSILKLLPFAEFSVNYGYAIENVWVTMIMIVHQTPSLIDSFVWILPIVLAVFFRPYIIKYIHQTNLKVYRQINFTSFSLIIGAIGCFIVGFSCDFHRKGKAQASFTLNMVKLFICTVGWTLMDIGFQFCLFFAEKIKESFEQTNSLKEQKNKKTQQQTPEKNQQFTQQNFAFYGLIIGYIVSALICWVIHGKSIKAFYKCAKYAYYSAGLIGIITGLRLYIQGKLNLPVKNDQILTEQEGKTIEFKIQKNIDFYLPGYQELKNSNFHTFCLLSVHFVIVFLNDIILIYTTMWFSDLSGSQIKSQGESYIYGLEVGSITLLAYTVLDNLKIKQHLFNNRIYFTASLVVIALLFLATSHYYGLFTFFILCLFLSIVNQFYKKTILAHQSEHNPVFERCIEVTQRIQKIFVLSVFPGVVLLFLNRDDIPDSLIWSSVMAIIGCVAFVVANINRDSPKHVESTKVQKIQ